MTDNTTLDQEPWFIWDSPWEELPSVTLDRDRWLTHIVTEHVYLKDKEETVGEVIQNATHVLEGSKTAGTANPDYVVFLNKDIVAKSGAPLVAMVSPQTGQLRTALYHRSFKDFADRKALWLRK